MLDEVQRAVVADHGYGARSFASGLARCYEQLLARRACEAGLEQRVEEVAARLAARPLTLLDGVDSTLSYLAERYPLVLVTKGDAEEQRRKVERSGLERRFRRIAIVPEKSEQTYRRIVDEDALDPARVWMIGNSPRSDVNPALAAGLNAVFVPHPHTWRFEHEELAAAPVTRLLVLDSFRQLRDHF